MSQQDTHSRAYLCLQLDQTRTPPRVLGAGIYSVPPWDIATDGNEIYACVLEAPGDIYVEARDRLQDIIYRTGSAWAWVQPLLETRSRPEISNLKDLRPLVNERIRQETARILRVHGKIHAVKYLRKALRDDTGQLARLRATKAYCDELESFMRLQDTTTIGQYVIPTVFLEQAHNKLEDPEAALRYLHNATGLGHDALTTILTYLRNTPVTPVGVG